MLAISWLAVSAYQATAAEEPTQLPAAAKLKWRVRESAKSAPANKPADPPLPAARFEVKQAAVQEPVAQVSTRASRAKLRNAVMQVSNETPDPFKDPFDDKEKQSGPVSDAAKLEAEGKPLSPTVEPAEPQPSFPTTTEPAPLRPDTDSFPNESIPLPPSQDFAPEATESNPEGCEADKADCRRAIDELQRRDITQILVGLSVQGVEGNDYPCECGLGDDVYRGRRFCPTTFNWKATATYHKPLYFEDAQLERYGHSWNPVLQPFMSAAHFFIAIPLIPYQMGINPPDECVYTLGYYRPGSCAPYMIEPIPLSLRGALYEAGAATAFAFWFWPPMNLR